MMRALAVCVLILSTSAAQAMVTVDPDLFASGTDISHSFAGVTLTAVGPGWGTNMTDSVFAVNPAAQPPGYGAFNASTGSLAFGSDDFYYPHLWAGPSSLQLRADFDSAISSVTLDFIGNSNSNPDVGVLYAYSAGGNLLDSASTGGLGLNSVGALTVADPAGNIAYVIAGGAPYTLPSGGTCCYALGLDNLRYEEFVAPAEPTPVPAPAAVVLSSIGLGVIGWLRQRRTL